MMKRIKLIEGSSIDLNVVNQVKEIAKTKSKILICLILITHTNMF